jgi:hypothetical protein
MDDQNRLACEALFSHSDAVRATSREVIASARAIVEQARQTVQRSHRLFNRCKVDELEPALVSDEPAH